MCGSDHIGAPLVLLKIRHQTAKSYATST